ncbi:preprotein translocase subunit SecG [Aquimonas voraii]|uniref:Protein-export membrane protein SecG n=1 Tax=Aquimonas voraii TaxID=265719 RepID=A0A1G6UEN8_9GAMM|nr:preprotein translocase subunit SecG [Aquimonas voraii]SDD39729.1 preprotein translocase subunit SecG [Aquimonas voraii]
MSSTVLTLANILYVLVSVAMIVMILLQRGAGAAAGSGFGAGASATVFGARGSANFLSKSTAILATLFFVISLGMAMYVARGGLQRASGDDLGVMGQIDAPAAQIPEAAAAPASVIPAAQPEAGSPVSPAAAEAAPAEVGVESVERAEEEQNPPSEGGSGE